MTVRLAILAAVAGAMLAVAYFAIENLELIHV